MKSFVPAALVVLLEAGFLFSVAMLPGPPERIQVRVEVAGGRPPAPAGPASTPTPRSRS